MLQWPHRIVVPLGGVDVDVRLTQTATELVQELRKFFDFFDPKNMVG